jgi:uncharacterized repeat protein (TIGR01451 family)
VTSIGPLVAVAAALVLSAPLPTVAHRHHEVSMVTTVDRPAGTGGTVRQTATVTDTGRLPLAGLHITLDLAPGCDWLVLLLLPGHTATTTCVGAAGTTDRVVTATVSGHDLLGRRVRAGAATTVRLPRPAVRLDVTATPALAVPGESVRYTASVTNSGDVPLDRLTVTATGLPSCDRPLPDPLAPGASTTVDCAATVPGQGIRFRVSGQDTFGDSVGATTAEDVHVVVPALTLALSGPPGPAPAGRDVPITVRLTDTSPVPLADLRITGTPTACDRYLPSLAADATVTYTCRTAVGTRTVVALTVSALPAMGGTAVPGAAAVTGHSTLVPLPAPATPAPVVAPTPVSTPTVPSTPPLPSTSVTPPPALAAPAGPVPPAKSGSPAKPAPPGQRVAPDDDDMPPPQPTTQATGPLADPARTALVIAVVAVLVMTVSVGALAAATRPGK